jgi:hypothetical protein
MAVLTRYDNWKLTPPKAPASSCAWCGDPAYNVFDRDDRPYAITPDGDGVLCSALCEASFALANDPRPERRVQALREALDAGLEREVRLRIETYSHRTGEGEAVVSGHVCDWDAHRLVMDFDDDEAGIGWERVLDAGLCDV